MKRYFLQVLGLAIVLSPMFGQQTIQLNDNSEQGYIMVSAIPEKSIDEKLLNEARNAHVGNVSVNAEKNEPIVADAFFVYPNPSKGTVQVRLTGKITVYVYTLSGQFLRKANMAPGE